TSTVGDTACSSGLVSLNLAVQSILRGEVEAAVVGGTNLCLRPGTSIEFQKLGAISDVCRTFDADAKGYARSEAIVSIFLQKSDVARRKYATIIHIKTNTDGYKDKGITYPSIEMQKRLFQEIYQECKLSPSQISYIETHGTGTVVGDPVEVSAIADVFCPGREEPLWIGSVKSNMGHAEPASGLCGLIKVLICMEKGLLAPNLHFHKPNPSIPALNSGQIRIPTYSLPWKAEYAGISAFGFGGVNTHAVLKSNDVVKKRHHDIALPQLVLYCGRTPENVQYLFDYLDNVELSREFFALLHKSAYSRSKVKIYRGYKLLLKDQQTAKIERVENEKRPVWYIFNCTGKQWTSISKEIMEIKVFANSIKKSAETLKPYGLDLIDLVLNQGKTKTDLRNITSAYSSTIATQIALIDTLNAVGIEPAGLIGQGVGELLCGYADGSLTAEQVTLAAYWIAKTLEETELEAGAMLDISESVSEIHEFCPNDIFLSRNLADEYVTVSGTRSSIKTFVDKMQVENILTKEVDSYGYALHCRLMHAATERLQKTLEKIMANPKPRSSRWISCSHNESEWNNPSTKLADASYFVHNLVSPILLHEALLHIPKDAIVMEISPHSLSWDVIARETEHIRLFEKDVDTTTSVLSCIGRLYILGLNPDVEKLYPEVQFPVPKSTPMISPLIKWDHSKSWPVPRWDERLGPSEIIFDVDVTSEESPEKYLLDHFIDGRYLYPACGYLFLAWQALAEMIHKNYEYLPVVFEDVTIHRATILSKTEMITFAVYITYIERKFEISERGSIVCTGRVNVLEETKHKDSTQCFKDMDFKNLSLDTRDVYKEFKLRGYEYGPNFQGIIGADIKGKKCLLKWTGKWVAFLDSLLQLTLLNFRERALCLPTRIQKISIDPVLHKAFMEKSLKEYQGVPAFQDKNTKKLTSGGIEINNLNVEFAHRNPNREIPLMEEYHFVPFHKENILPKSNEMTLKKYIDVCTSVAEKTLEFLGKSRDEVTNILKGSTYADYASTKDCIESQADNHILLKSLCTLMDAATNQDFMRKAENQVNSYLFQRDADILSETLLQEKPLREAIDIVIENNDSRKLKIAEVSNCSRPLCYKINEMIQKNCVNVNYAIAHSNLELMDKSCLPSENVSVSSWDPDTSLSFKDMDLFVMKYLIGSKEKHTQTLKNALVRIKDGGFVILLLKTRLVPAEMFLSSVGKTTVPVLSEPDLEQTFKELKLRIICKKSDALTSTLYLLRKVSVKSYQDSVIQIEVGKYEKWVTELKEQIIEITSHPKDPKRIWLVSEGTNLSGIIGLVNCLRLEPGGSSVRCVFISESAPDLPQFNPKLQFYQEIMEKDLTMNVFKTNSWGTYRHFKMSEGSEVDEMEHAYLNILTRGNLSSLTWIDSPLKYSSARDSDSLLCHVYYASLNFRDIMMATGKLSQSNTSIYNWTPGFEVAGRLDSGHRIMAFCQSPGVATTVIAESSLTWDVPDDWTLEEASTVPVAYSTAYYALVMRGRIQRGERVLIHSGSGGVGQASITIALHYGCEVFTSVGSKEKREFLKKRFPSLQDRHFCNSRDLSFEKHILRETNGEGVEVILNSLAEEKLKASLNCMAQNGRFLEIGKYDLFKNTIIGLELFSKNISFHGILVDALWDNTPCSLCVKKELVQLLYDGIASGSVRPLNSIVFDYKDAENAFRYMASGKHIGKVVIKIRSEEPQIKVAPTPIRVFAISNALFNPEQSYVIIGGLGGFGLELCQWMVERGAKHIILTSRSGIRTGYQKLCMNRWNEEGVNIIVSTENAVNMNEAKLLLQKATSIKPVGGIFNLALILRDAFMENQTVRNFKEVCASKVTSTVNLDALSRDLCPHLQWFVCFSSVSCGRGNAGQANYGYANSVMERICENRAHEGLPGLAIQWGPIGDVGVLQDTVGSDVVISGMISQSIRSCLSVLEKFLQKKHPVVLSCIPYLPEEISSPKASKRSILSAVGKIFELGMDSLIEVELKLLLDRECDLVLGSSELRKLTIKDLGILEGPICIEDGSETPDSKVAVTYDIEEAHLGSNAQDNSWLIPKETIVHLNSVKSGIPLFVVHPIEGTVGMLYSLAQLITVPVFGIQYTSEAPKDSFEKVAAWYWA
ncbi:fatty acid synthase, partial [Trichonephila clavata]